MLKNGNENCLYFKITGFDWDKEFNTTRWEICKTSSEIRPCSSGSSGKEKKKSRILAWISIHL